jgi:hypothetical protein
MKEHETKPMAAGRQKKGARRQEREVWLSRGEAAALIGAVLLLGTALVMGLRTWSLSGPADDQPRKLAQADSEKENVPLPKPRQRAKQPRPAPAVTPPAPESPPGGEAKENGKAGNEEPQGPPQQPPKQTPAQPPGEPSGSTGASSKPGGEQPPGESSAAAPLGASGPATPGPATPEQKPVEPPPKPVKVLQRPEPPPAGLRAGEGNWKALPELGAPAGANGSSRLCDLRTRGEEVAVFLHGLEFANEHPDDPGMKLVAVRERLGEKINFCALEVAFNAPENSAAEFSVGREKQGGMWLRFSWSRTAFSERERRRLRSLCHCVLEVRSDAGSELFALKEPCKVDGPVAVKRGVADLSDALKPSDAAAADRPPVTDYDLLLGEGKVHIGSKSEKTKEAFPFADQPEPTGTYDVPKLADKYKLEAVKVVLAQPRRGRYEIQVRPPAIETGKNKEAEDKKKLDELNKKLQENNKEIGKLGREVNRDRGVVERLWQTPPGRDAMRALAKLLDLKPPEPPPRATDYRKAPLKHPDARFQEAKYQEALQEYYSEKVKPFLENVSDKEKEKREKLDKDNKDLTWQVRSLTRTKAQSQEEAVKRLLESVDGVSGVLYRMVDGIRVDTVVIRD